MSNHKFKTSVIEQKHSEPKKEKSILYRPDNPRPKNSSLSQKIPDNFFLQSTEKKEIKLDNNKNSELLINSENKNIQNYPIIINNSNNISNSKFIFI